MHARPAVRPGIGVRDEGCELQRRRAGDLLGRVVAYGDKDKQVAFANPTMDAAGVLAIIL